MKILITGSDGFIGKNLKAELINRKYTDIYEFNSIRAEDQLEKLINECDFIFHLLTVYRSEDTSAFKSINTDLTNKIVQLIDKKKKTVILLSSTQAGTETEYGKSKFEAEESLKKWADVTGNHAYIFRLAHEFGKWCPPNLNSVVATFCYNIANQQDIKINNRDAELKLMYIDDIVKDFVTTMEYGSESIYCNISNIYETTVGEVADILYDLKSKRENCDILSMDDQLIKKLYSTYLSHLPSNDFSITLEKHIDNRGSFTELLHFGNMGQVSVNISKPGITKGNHWHHTKTEKFIVISGKGVIKFRKHGESKIIEYQVSDERFEVVDIPPGYTHSISNVGDTDLITIMWANEVFNEKNSDTYFEEV